MSHTLEWSRTPPVAYYHPDEIVEYKDGLSRELAHIVRRLDLLATRCLRSSSVRGPCLSDA